MALIFYSPFTFLCQPTLSTLLISLLTQSSHLKHGCEIIPSLLLRQPIHSLCILSSPTTPSVQLIAAGILPISPWSLLAPNLFPQFIYPSIHPLHSHNPPDPVVLTHLQPLLLSMSMPSSPDWQGTLVLHKTPEHSLSISLIFFCLQQSLHPHAHMYFFIISSFLCCCYIPSNFMSLNRIVLCCIYQIPFHVAQGLL